MTAVQRIQDQVKTVGRKTLGTALRELPRWRKRRRQLRHPAPVERPTIGFVLGTQRSGTTMLLNVLDTSPETEVYHEYHPAAMDSFRLRPPVVIEKLASRSAARALVLKPITDSHRADWLLQRFPDARAIWVFRRYEDVANSAIAMWPGENVEFVNRVREDNLPAMDWRGERVSEEVLSVIGELARQPLNEQEGAALFWYARNALYFELGLADDARVLLVQYEDLVEDPTRFRAIFDHLGLAWDEAFVEQVKSTSVGRRPFGPIREDVRAVCDAMMERLVEAEGRAGTPAAVQRGA
jgi:hypothetical protein